MTNPPDLSKAAAALGRKGGQSTSEAKQAAARENGKRGGRPRKAIGENIMKQIMEYNNDTDRWEPLGASYSGLSTKDAEKALKQLRQWAKDDGSGKKYKARDVVIVPR